MNKRILILSNDTSGLLKFRKELIQSLLFHNYDVVVSTPSDPNSSIAALGCVYKPIPIDRRGSNPFKDLRLLNMYERVIQQFNPFCVLTFTIKPNIYGGIACKKNNIPYIVNVTGLGTSIQDGGLISIISLALYKIGLCKATKVFFQNRSNRQFFIEKKIVNDDSIVIPGSGVNLIDNRFEEYPEDDGRFVFNTIGRIMADKGVFELLDAAESIKKDFKNVSFQMIGNYEENLRETIEKAEKQGTIVYLGFKDNVHDYIKNSSATIHPSYHEGMSNVLLETAACGRPVIATDVPGCIEAFDDGISGIAFKSHDSYDLERAIRCFLEMSYGKRKDMGIAGRKKMEKEFNRQIVVDSYLEEISKVCGGKE